jgi:hypothetical protein
MHGEEPGELLLVKLIRSYMAYRILWSEIHREAFCSHALRNRVRMVLGADGHTPKGKLKDRCNTE